MSRSSVRVGLALCAGAVALAGGCYQEPRGPVAALTHFDPPAIQVLVPQQQAPGTLPAGPVLTAPLSATVDIVPRIGHAGPVLAVDVSADGQLVVSASRDRTLKVWDVRSGALLHSYRSDEVISAVAILPGGRRALTAARDGSLAVWALASGQQVVTLVGHKEAVTALALAPDGKRVLSAADDEVLLWDLEATEVLSRVVMSGPVLAAAFTPDAADVVLGLGDGTLQRLSGNDLTLRRSIPGHAREVTAVATSGDGRRVLSASADGRLKLWDVLSGALLSVVAGHAKPVRSVALSKAGDRALSVSDDGTVKHWDVENQRVIGTMRGHTGAVLGVAVTPRLERAVSGGADGSVRVWELPAGEAAAVMEARDDGNAFVSLSESGRSLFSASTSGALRMWDLSSLALTKSWRAEGNVQGITVTAAALAPDANQALTAISEPQGQMSLQVWDTIGGRVVHTFDAGPEVITSVAFAPFGLRALSGGMLGSLHLWGVAIRRPLRELLGHNSPIRATAVSDDGRRALTSAVAPTIGPDLVKLWDLDSGGELASFEGYAVGALAGDGQSVLLGSRAGELSYGEVSRAAARAKWPAHGAAVRSVAIAPRARRAASGGEDGTLKIWDLPGGQLSRSFSGHRGPVVGLSFSADAKRLVSWSEDGTTRVWRLETGASVTLLAGGEEWIAYSDDGYFVASPRGGELAYAISGLSGFRLDQLSVRHNRPDLLLERLGVGAPELVSDFAARHRRRLRTLGTTEADLAQSFGAAPEVTITKLEQVGRVANVTFAVRSVRKRARYQVLVNGVPLFAEPRRVEAKEITESFELIGGANHIAVEVIDSAGAQAIPATYVVRHDEPTPKGTLYYLGVGVSHYAESGLDLKYAHKDVADLARALARAKGFYRDVKVQTLLDDEASAASIGRLAAFLETATVDDTVVLVLAGHWANTREAPADAVFLPHDADPERLGSTGLGWRALARLFANAKPRRRLVVVDGCVSGDRDRADLKGTLAEVSRRGLSLRTSSLLWEPANTPPRSYLFQGHRMVMDGDVGQSGAVLLRASRGDELCYELDDLRNGAMTAALLRALSSSEADANGDDRVSLEELESFVATSVANMTGGLQRPVLVRDGVEQPIELPRLGEAPVTPPPEPPRPEPVRPPPACGCTAGAHAGSAGWLLALGLVLMRRRRR
jgi:WD40 repeat protein